MFDEPIRVGLIRFADAYDHYNQQRHQQHSWQSPANQAQVEGNSTHFGAARETGRPPGRRRRRHDQEPEASAAAQRQARAARDFDLSHQPLLVLYTTRLMGAR